MGSWLCARLSTAEPERRSAPGALTRPAGRGGSGAPAGGVRRGRELCWRGCRRSHLRDQAAAAAAKGQLHPGTRAAPPRDDRAPAAAGGARVHPARPGSPGPRVGSCVPARGVLPRAPLSPWSPSPSEPRRAGALRLPRPRGALDALSPPGCAVPLGARMLPAGAPDPSPRLQSRPPSAPPAEAGGHLTAVRRCRVRTPLAAGSRHPDQNV